MHLRRAKVTDAEAVAGVYIGSRAGYVAFAPLAHSEEDVRDWIKRVLIPKRRVFVLEEDGTIVAMMAISVRRGAGWIDQLYVAHGRTGRGYGTVLLECVIEKLPSPIYLYSFQENLGARRFYERNGFESERFSDGADNEERCPDVLYRRNGKKPQQSGPANSLRSPLTLNDGRRE